MISGRSVRRGSERSRSRVSKPLRAEITSILSDSDLPFDQAVISVDPRLNYSELKRVVNLLGSLNVTKISFDRAEAGSAR